MHYCGLTAKDAEPNARRFSRNNCGAIIYSHNKPCSNDSQKVPAAQYSLHAMKPVTTEARSSKPSTYSWESSGKTVPLENFILLEATSNLSFGLKSRKQFPQESAFQGRWRCLFHQTARKPLSSLRRHPNDVVTE